MNHSPAEWRLPIREAAREILVLLAENRRGADTVEQRTADRPGGWFGLETRSSDGGQATIERGLKLAEIRQYLIEIH